MSARPASTAPTGDARYRPTASFVRAVLIAAGTSALALITGRPDLAVIAAPFVVWSIIGALGRPRGGQETPTLAVSARTIGTGDSVAVTVRADGRVVDLSVRTGAGADLDPVWGGACGLDAASVKVRPRRWGRLVMEDAVVVATDAHGMWRRDLSLPIGAIDVSPTAVVPGRGDAIPHPIGVAGIHHSRRPGDGSALVDIRAYVPGDRLTRINWRVTSRSGALHTNATTGDRDTDVLIVVDTLTDATSAQMTGASVSSLDATVVAAASLAEHYLRLGDRVAVHDLGSLVSDLPPRSGIRQYSSLVARLGGVRRDAIVDWTLRPVRRLRPGTFAVVCSPLLDERVLGEIAALSRRGATVLVVDTLPERLGRIERGPLDRSWLLRRVLGAPAVGSVWEETWALRRLQREGDLGRLRDVGVPVAPWRGVGGVGALAAALAARRPTARTGSVPR